MIVAQSNAVIESCGLEDNANFRLKPSAKAFRILSSGLYSNKFSAPVREISTNAVDAQISVGKGDMPFEVHLPTRFEPEFFVRDFGPGLSHEDILVVYTTYFESTKTQSNAYTGCLGLGSKSPFAYCDSFQVTSFKDGQGRDYVCFMSEEGIPSISSLAHYHTDEPNGLKVSFAVEAKDIEKFVSEARNIYQWFKVKPKLNMELNYPAKPDGFISLGKLEFYPSGSYIHESTVVMGNVAYPLPSQRVANNYFIYHADIGEFEVTASREALEMSKATLARLEVVKKEGEALIKDYVDTLLAGATNAFEASILYHQKGVSRFSGAATWRGQSLSSSLNCHPTDLMKWRKRSYKDTIYSESTSYLDLTQKFVVLHNDKGLVKPNQKIKYLLESDRDIQRIYEVDQTALDALLALGLPLSYVRKLSDVIIPKNHSGSTGPREKHMFTLQWERECYNRRLSECSVRIPFDKGAEGYYIEMEGANLVGPLQWRTLSNICYYLKELGHKVALFGIPKSSAKLIKESKLRPIQELISKVADKYKDKGLAFANLDNERLSALILELGLVSPAFKEASDLFNEIKDNKTEYVLANSFMGWAGLSPEKPQVSWFDNYPMLKIIINSGINIPDMNVLTNYIKLEDSK
jgi:hypothetical protein